MLNLPRGGIKNTFRLTLAVSALLCAPAAFADCAVSNPDVTLNLQPAGLIQRDVLVGTVLSTTSVTSTIVCNTTGMVPGERWIYTAASTNVDLGAGASTSVRKTPYPGIALFWTNLNNTGSSATWSRFLLNDTTSIRRQPTQATPGIANTFFSDTIALWADGPIAAGMFPGYSFAINYGSPNDASPANRLVTFTIPPFAVNAVACSVLESVIPVPMGTVEKRSFGGVGSTSEDVPFSIPLECDANTRVNITLQGNADASGAPGVLALNNDADSATGVGVQILQGGTPVTFNNLTYINTTAVDGPFNIDYTARYYKTAANMTTGGANATATFTMTYR